MKTNELLRRYVEDRSEPAFEELVKQYIDLVYSSALRQVNGDAPAAQDVTQAVFTELARHAPRLTRHTSLAGWLYTSTRYLAAKALRTEQRRRSHEQEAHEMNQLLQSTDLDTTWQEMRPLLDDAMHDLSASDREAILLRYFERLPLAEIGSRLGLKENAAHMRIERAIDRLRAALSKRGVTSTLTALALLLTGRAVGAAPAGLAAQVSHAALATAAATGGLTWGLLKLAGLVKGKAVLAAGAAVLVASFIVMPKWLASATTAPAAALSSATRESARALRPTAAGLAAAASSTRSSASKTADKITLRIIAEDTEQPVAGAAIEYFVAEKGRRISPAPTPMTATDQGVCEIPISRATVGTLTIQSRTDGFVDMVATWWPDRGEEIPQQYTLRLARSVPIGGQVVDEAGQPISGAQVQFDYQSSASTANAVEPPHLATQAQEKTVTDAEGRWRIDRFAKEAVSMLYGVATHPDYFNGPLFKYSDGAGPEVEKQLLTGAYLFQLTRGMTVRGVIVDKDGQIVTGAKVAAAALMEDPPLARGRSITRVSTRAKETTNQADGTFTLTGCKPGTNRFTVEARGFAWARVEMNLARDATPLRFVLQPGNVLRLRVLDPNGQPVSNCLVGFPSQQPIRRGVLTAAIMVEAASRRGRFGIEPVNRFRSDAEGRVAWDSAPSSEVELGFSTAGLQSTNILVPADGQEHVVTLTSAHPADQPQRLTVSGSVRDAASGLPIPRFRVSLSRSPLSQYGPDWSHTESGQDGKFLWVDNMRYDETRPGSHPVSLKIEADGYAPLVSRVVQTDEGEAHLDITLMPSAPTTVTVLLPNGSPAANTGIGLDMPGARLKLSPGTLWRPTPEDYNNVLSTDDKGRFALPADEAVTRVVAVDAQGYAEATPAALIAQPTMRLQPWGRLEGTFFSDGKPASGVELGILNSNLADRLALDGKDFTCQPEANGHFAFPKVPPGTFRVIILNWGNSSYVHPPLADATVRPSETTNVSLVSCTVTAHLRWPSSLTRAPGWRIQAEVNRGDNLQMNLVAMTGGGLTIEDLAAGSDPGRRDALGPMSLITFAWVPGSYTLQVDVFEPMTTRAEKARRVLSGKSSFTVSADPPSGALDLGEILLQPVP
jgi:RNA polymerase sigma factor (sigma-70 family)